MRKQSIKFTNFNGEEKTATEYFNLNKRELLAIAAKYAPQSADLEEVSKTLVEAGDLNTQLKFIDDVILTAYGKRDADGIVFEKSQQIREQFENSAIYDSLFNLLMTNQEEMKGFIAALPQDQAKMQSLSEAPRASK